MADGTEYLINIAARMQGGDAAASQLDNLAGTLAGVAGKVPALEGAMQRVESALEQAGAASTVAGDAVKASERSYAQMERAADRAAKALERAQNQGKSAATIAKLQAKATAAAGALRKEAAALDDARAAAERADAAHKRLGGSLKNLSSASRHARNNMPTHDVGDLSDSFRILGGPMGEAGDRTFEMVEGLQKLKRSLGATRAIAVVAAVAVVALAVAFVALGVAIVAGIVKVTAWGVSLADAKRSAKLNLQALEQLDGAYKGLSKTIPKVAKETGLSQDALVGLAKQLKEAKVSAEDMPAALKAMAIAEAALGQGGSADFLKQLQEGKKTVGELSKEITGKFGPIVKKKMLSLDSLWERFKKNIGETFGGLKIEGLLKGLEKLVNLFDASTASGQTMKFLFEQLFQPLVNGAAKAATVVEAFFLGMAIGALKIYIALKPTIKAAQELLGLEGTSLTDALLAAKNAGQVFAGVVVVGAALIIGLFAAVGGAVYAMVGPMVQGIGIAKAAWASIGGVGAQVLATLAGFVGKIGSIGGNMVSSLAASIKAGAAAVVEAITGVVQGGIDAAKNLLGIASPSKVFGLMGQQTAAGFAGGVDDGATDTRTALERMVDPPAMKSSTDNSTSSSRTVNITFGDVNGEGGQDIAAHILDMLEGLLDPEPEPAT